MTGRRDMEFDGLIGLPGIRAHVAAIRCLQDALAAFFRFFSLTYQVANGRLLQVLLTHLPGSQWPPSSGSSHSPTREPMAAFFRFFSLTYQVVSGWIAKPSILIYL
jgi:hypothetical protein